MNGNITALYNLLKKAKENSNGKMVKVEIGKKTFLLNENTILNLILECEYKTVELSFNITTDKAREYFVSVEMLKAAGFKTSTKYFKNGDIWKTVYLAPRENNKVYITCGDEL